MAKLTPISQRDLIRRFQNLGFEGPFVGGKHPIMARGGLRVTLPNPHDSDIGPDLLSRILRQSRISRREWESSQ
jgi:predicted RNA binding protein YcfA (HicA-like mRNA interferase family)